MEGHGQRTARVFAKIAFLSLRMARTPRAWQVVKVSLSAKGEQADSTPTGPQTIGDHVIGLQDSGQMDGK